MGSTTAHLIPPASEFSPARRMGQGGGPNLGNCGGKPLLPGRHVQFMSLPSWRRALEAQAWAPVAGRCGPNNRQGCGQSKTQEVRARQRSQRSPPLRRARSRPLHHRHQPRCTPAAAGAAIPEPSLGFFVLRGGTAGQIPNRSAPSSIHGANLLSSTRVHASPPQAPAALHSCCRRHRDPSALACVFGPPEHPYPVKGPPLVAGADTGHRREHDIWRFRWAVSIAFGSSVRSDRHFGHAPLCMFL
ncbi:hypothetical protein NDU88_004133 [Pleurodeles waltl]|uniref:Uncharacterized protein n=1 Tax=Pleurodeles waltl TaxID=8319 RepID=A0AAV7M7G8_PLEWA|nr:hypothetical protein NDU88_004133 [Pleurodeles waltl]